MLCNTTSEIWGNSSVPFLSPESVCSMSAFPWNPLYLFKGNMFLLIEVVKGLWWFLLSCLLKSKDSKLFFLFELCYSICIRNVVFYSYQNHFVYWVSCQAIVEIAKVHLCESAAFSKSVDIWLWWNDFWLLIYCDFNIDNHILMTRSF